MDVRASRSSCQTNPADNCLPSYHLLTNRDVDRAHMRVVRLNPRSVTEPNIVAVPGIIGSYTHTCDRTTVGRNNRRTIGRSHIKPRMVPTEELADATMDWRSKSSRSNRNRSLDNQDFRFDVLLIRGFNTVRHHQLLACDKCECF